MERERQANWDATHLHTASTKLTNKEYELLRRACEHRRTSIYGLVKLLLRGWLMDFAREDPVAADDIMRRLR